ncbi:MAG: pilus assembly protein [Desulfuromonadales bacterium]|nr:pilus assembly protein [Desulfuromonadales bacterium]
MKICSLKNTERGAALVEFTIMLPLLLAILVGIVEFGLLFYNKQVLTNASREGARAGSARTLDDISGIVDVYCGNRLISFGAAPICSTTTTGTFGAFSEDISVTVDSTYTFLVPELIGFGPTMQLSGKTVMKMERVESSP